MTINKDLRDHLKKPSEKKIISLRGCLFSIALLLGGIYAVYFVCAKVLFMHSLPVYAISNSFKTLWAWTKNIESLEYVSNGKEEKLWVISYYDPSHYTWDKYFIDLINPAQKRLEKSIALGYLPIGMSSRDMANWERTANNLFFISNKKLPFQFRDGFTGEITKTEADMIRNFPQLKAGIGEIIKTTNYEPDWYELTTKDGLKFLYQPASNLLKTKEEIEKELEGFNQWNAPIDFKNPKIKKCFAWGLGNDEVRKELYLVSEYKHIYNLRLNPNQLKTLNERRKGMDEELANIRKNYEESRKREEKLLNNEKYYEARRKREKDYNTANKESMLRNLEEEFKKSEEAISKRYEMRNQKDQQLLMHLKDKVFLNGKVIYGDSTLCVVLHATEIGKSAQNILTCVDKSGKIRWEIVPVPSNVLLVELNMADTYIKTHRQGDNLVILNKYAYGDIGACKLSLKDGKVIWDLDLM